MSYENVEEVVEEHDPVSANKRIAEGWSLLTIVPGFNPATGQAYTCYVLGKVISVAEQAARLIRKRFAENEQN